MQKTLITIDTNTRAQIDQTGAFINRVANYVNVERDQWQILCFQFYNRAVSAAGAVTLEAYAFPAGTSFMLIGDNDFTNTDCMFKSLQSLTDFDESDPISNMINIAGDWIDGSTADFALGQISVRVNTHTPKFQSVMGTTEVQKTSGLYMNLKMYEAGISNPSTVAWIPFVGKNSISDLTSSQVVPPTGTEAIAFINAFLRNPLERRWTSDELTWYTSQGSNTLYQERIANIGADWGPTVTPVAYIVPEAIQGNFAAFDSSGNIADSGIGVSADGTFAAESDELVPTQKAVKTALDRKSDLAYFGSTWGSITFDSSVSVAASNGICQKISATDSLNIIPPVLSSNDPYLRLEVITGGYSISISSSEIVSSGAPATYLLDWYWDGSATMRHAPQEVFE